VCKAFNTSLPDALDLALDDLASWYDLALELAGKQNGGS